MIIVGVDPDSDRHGVAVYEDKVLTNLSMMTRNEIIDEFRYKDCLFSIEDVCANDFIYNRNSQGSKKAQSRIALYTGRCQQSQAELIRDLEYYSMPYATHKPQKGNWADNKSYFEKITGWTNRSNKDTRSAAYFGYLEINK